MRTIAMCAAATLAMAGSFVVRRAGAADATPLEPVAAIVEALRSHPVVAISDGRHHGDVQAHVFLISLIGDPRFASLVDDIVVECCSARYQAVVDRYVGGADVSHDDLAAAWQNSTQVNANQRDCGFCERMFAAVRASNASPHRRHPLRVLLGDPPIEWETVRTKDDYQRWLEQRDTFPADLIQREAIAKRRHALIVYGGMHLQRKNLVANYESGGAAATLVSLLESKPAVFVFTIWAAIEPEKLQPDVAAWPVPSLSKVRGTTLGAADFAAYYTSPLPRIAIRDGKPDFSSPVPRDRWKTLRMDDQFDAILYLGPTLTYEQVLAPDMCADTGYMQVLRRRMALVGLEPEIDRLNRYCASLKGG